MEFSLVVGLLLRGRSDSEKRLAGGWMKEQEGCEDNEQDHKESKRTRHDGILG
jgi:hypothetical protein